MKTFDSREKKQRRHHSHVSFSQQLCPGLPNLESVFGHLAIQLPSTVHNLLLLLKSPSDMGEEQTADQISGSFLKPPYFLRYLAALPYHVTRGLQKHQDNQIKKIKEWCQSGIGCYHQNQLLLVCILPFVHILRVFDTKRAREQTAGG